MLFRTCDSQALDKCQLGDVVRGKEEKLEASGEVILSGYFFIKILCGDQVLEHVMHKERPEDLNLSCV